VVGAKSVVVKAAPLVNFSRTSMPLLGLHGSITGDDGKLHRFGNIYLNDEDIRYQGPETPVQDGDVLSILPAVAGALRRGSPCICEHSTP
jgi:hypothetical protein